MFYVDYLLATKLLKFQVGEFYWINYFTYSLILFLCSVFLFFISIFQTTENFYVSEAWIINVFFN